jgi:hypothetical protein
MGVRYPSSRVRYGPDARSERGPSRPGVGRNSCEQTRAVVMSTIVADTIRGAETLRSQLADTHGTAHKSLHGPDIDDHRKRSPKPPKTPRVSRAVNRGA